MAIGFNYRMQTQPVDFAADRALEIEQQRNALMKAGQLQAQQQQGDLRNALMGGDYRGAAAMDPQNARTYMGIAGDQRTQAFHGIASRALEYVASPSPRALAMQRGTLAAFAEDAGKPPEALTDEDIRQYARADAQKAVTAGGLDPKKFPGLEPSQPSGALYKTPGQNGQPMYADATGRQLFPAYVEPQTPRQQEPPKPQLTEVVLPDGRVQKQWVMPGQASGTPVGAPTSPNAQRSNPMALRKEFNTLPEVKAYKDVLPLIKAAERMPDTGAGDINLIYTFGKVMDPGSVVREGELALVLKSGSLLEQILGTTRFQLGKGGRLDAGRRQQLLETLNERVAQYGNAYNQAREQYSSYAADSGLDPVSVVGPNPSDAYPASKPAPASAPTPGPARGQKIKHASGAIVTILE